MAVGLGTGSTVAELVPALGRRRPGHHLCCDVARHRGARARAHGLAVRPFTDIDRLDIAIDGADQVDPAGWLVKGGGGAHARERIVAAAADRFVVIVSSDKPVERLRPPVPLELLAFGLSCHAARAGRPRCSATRRDARRWGPGRLARCRRRPRRGSPRRLDAVPGLVSHGLFPPAMVSAVLIGPRRDRWRPRPVTGLRSAAGSGQAGAAGSARGARWGSGRRRRGCGGRASPGSSARSASRSSTRLSSARVSSRARCIPRHMCGPWANAMWGRAGRKMSKVSGSSQRVSSWLAEPMCGVMLSPVRW